MTPARPWVGILTVGIAAGIDTVAAAQTEVHHHFRFDIGAEAATVTTTFRGCRGGQLKVAMPRFVARASRPLSLDSIHDKLVVTSSTGARATRSSGAWTVDTSGETTVVLTHETPLTGRQVQSGLGQRQSHTFEVAGESKVIRYYQGYSLRAATTWLFAPANAGTPQRITFQLPAGFKVASTLSRSADGSYRTPDFATLADSPFHIGTSRVLEFQAAGRKYRVHLTGFERDRTDLVLFQSQLKKIAYSQAHSLGPNGQESYVYLVGRRTTTPSTIGHRNGAEILTHSLRSSNAQLLNISRAHLWSWMYPLQATNLQQPTAGPESWFFQGVTEYLAEISLVRAGFTDPKKYWTAHISAHINKLQRDPRRLTVSVTDAGTHLQRRGPKKSPLGPDPKTKGLLIGLLLDIEIRSRSLNTRSLDGAIQAMVKRRVPVTNRKIADACAETLGKPLEKFFAAFVHGTGELPLQTSLARVGIIAQAVSATLPKKGNPRMPKPNRRRPPRWQVRLAEKPSESAVGTQTRMTQVVAK
ncbi:MAG: hypothetical protein VX951_14740 [Planctomycetota bacterium]|nr:hypothetical protein [Planctomycetota bacterium]